MTLPVREIWMKVWPLAAGIVVAVLIIIVFQLLSPMAFPPYEQENPFAYSEQVEQFRPKQVRNELLGLAIGIVAAVLLYRQFRKPKNRVYALLIPGIILLIISFSLWHFVTPVELLWLALPVWTLLALISYHTGEYFSRLIKTKKPNDS